LVRVTICACAIAVVSLVAGTAIADESAAAEALFISARELMSKGDFDAACPKLEASQKLDPALGTMLNLGFCYESRGQLASAWAQYRAAAAQADREGQGERARFAAAHVAVLEPRLITLAIRTHEDGVEVTRDGVVLERAVIGVALPVDPGPHEVRARAPGKTAWRSEITMDARTPHVVVDVPPLADEPHAQSPVDEPHVAGPHLESGPTVTPPRDAESDGARRPLGARRIAALSFGAAGAAGLVTGTVFGAVALSKWSDATSHHCIGNECDPQGLSLASDARRSASASSLSLVLGGAALVAGATLWFSSAPSPASNAASNAPKIYPVVGASAAGMGLSGAF
jgi:hypothetical protein